MGLQGNWYTQRIQTPCLSACRFKSDLAHQNVPLSADTPTRRMRSSVTATGGFTRRSVRRKTPSNQTDAGNAITADRFHSGYSCECILQFWLIKVVISLCKSLDLIAVRKKWQIRRPVTSEIAGSNPVAAAKQKPRRLGYPVKIWIHGLPAPSVTRSRRLVEQTHKACSQSLIRHKIIRLRKPYR